MVGKRVSGDLYVHRTAIKHLENEDGLLVTEYMKKLEAYIEAKKCRGLDPAAKPPDASKEQETTV